MNCIRANSVKCDEAHPICVKCQRNGRSCSYGQETIRSALGESRISKDEHSLSIATALPLVLGCVEESPMTGTSTAHLLHHFHTHWTSILYRPPNHQILSISKSSELLRNTILVVAASHLSSVSPGISQHRIAEHFYQSLVLRDLQCVVATPRKELEQIDADALMIVALMLNMVSFTLPTSEESLYPNPETSWVFSTRKDRLGWLSLQVGLRPLLLSMGSYLETTIAQLGPIFLGGPLIRGTHTLENVPQVWKDFFSLNEDSGSEGCDSAGVEDVFRAPVSVLIQLRNLEPVCRNLFKNLQFLGKVQRDFQDLLLAGDEKALWLFGYWLGVMCRYRDVWWCEKRSRRDYEAICLWLKRRRGGSRSGSVEERVWTHMMEELLSVVDWDLAD
jgi:hypothetical protein